LDENTVSELSKIYGVSKQVIMLRLLWLGYIPKERYEYFRKEAEKKIKGKPFGRRDWDKVFQNRVGNLVVRETTNAYRNGKISYSEVMDILNLKAKYTEKFIER
jgi:Zn-dependent peptidase ImmA (M78 family)